MKCVVTGGAGFIGSHLVEHLLSKGCQVTVIDNLTTGRLDNLKEFEEKISFIEADLSEGGTFNKAFDGVDTVFHLAALADIVPSIQRPNDYFQANVVGTFNVLQQCYDCGVRRILYAASSSCYGLTEEIPTPETAAIAPEYPYALTKRLGEEILLHWGKVFGLNVSSLRLFNVYGPKSRTSGTYGAMFGVFLAQKLAKKPFTVVGDGAQSRDFTYVSDVVSAFFEVSQNIECDGEVFNVGSGAAITINRITELLCGDVEYIPKRPGEPEITFADISRIKEQIGWSPKIKIDEGINKLLENIEYWADAPIWTADKIAEETKDWFKYLS